MSPADTARTSSPSNLHTAWARLFVSALAGAGVRHVVVSPGSRSTPLVLAAAAEARITCHTILDERAAGFFALGQARVTGIPTVLLCTSGTAAAHYFPAVIEASLAFVPLLVLSADRPWDAYDAGASQTIDQTKLFGGHVRHFAELGLPDAAPSALRAVARIAAQAFARSLSPTPGPVHVNARFRKPLEPVSVDAREPWAGVVEHIERQGPPHTYASAAVPDAASVDEVTAACVRARRGLIVCGPLPVFGDPTEREKVIALARATGFPVFAEATSQMRFGGLGEGVTHVSSLGALLRSPAFRSAHPADVIVELGSAPTSGTYATYIAELPGAARFVVTPHGHLDPDGSARAVIQANPSSFAAAVAGRVLEHAEPRPTEWAAALARADARAWERIARDTGDSLVTEATVARSVVAALPEGGALVVGNSSPVRDLDTYVPPSPRAIRVIHQRGAAGIDGLVAGAAGASSLAASPLVLLLGDLSFLHDIGGLAVARHAERPLVIVVVNNEGGRLFEELPVAASAEARFAFDRHFIVTQDVSLASAAAAFSVRYHRVADAADLDRALHDGLSQPGCTILEASVTPDAARERRARLRADLDALARSP